MNSIKKAFTLLELLIVVAIIGVLAGVGVPMYNGYVLNANVVKTGADMASVKQAATFPQLVHIRYAQLIYVLLECAL